MDAQARIDELEARNSELEVENAALRARVVELSEQVALLVGKVADLEKRLGRNSSNSSKPPSTDPGSAKSDRPENANRAARRAMGRKQGKQPGTPGSTLSQVADPDVVFTHQPQRCRGCDGTLEDALVVGEAVRQVFDVADPTVVVTEHRAEKRRCRCGCETTAVFTGRRIRFKARSQSERESHRWCADPTRHSHCQSVRRARMPAVYTAP